MAGRYRGGADSSLTCLLCPAGFSQPDMNSASCLPCIPGRVTNKTAATICNNCGQDMFQVSIAGTRCLTCPFGRRSSTGSAQCSSCQAGQHQGTVTINQSTADNDAGRGGLFMCLPCEPGFFQALPGQQSCTACPPGRGTLPIMSIILRLGLSMSYAPLSLPYALPLVIRAAVVVLGVAA